MKTSWKGLTPVVLLLALCLVSAAVCWPQERVTMIESTELRGDGGVQYEVAAWDYRLQGDIIAASLEDLRAANDSLLNPAAWEQAEIFLTVDGVPLTQQEWNYRKAMNAVRPQQRTEYELLQILIREKVQQAKAIACDGMPTEQEIQEHLRLERQQWSELEEAEAILAQICESGLTPNEYWNVYERYNWIRILINENVYQWYGDAQGLADDYDYDVYWEAVDRWAGEAKLEYQRRIVWRFI